LVLAVYDDDAPAFVVDVVYGTSQPASDCTASGEFSIQRDRNPAAFAAAGLSFDTQFDLRQLVQLPCNADWFSVPPAAPCGQNPTLGVLHPSLVRAVEAAYRASRS
jgi:hypothetical protein